jgi:hypothetical protein
MSLLDDAAKVTLLPLIRGEACSLDQEDQALIARWVTLKLTTAEFADFTKVVTPPEDRHALRGGSLPPENWSIWIAEQSSRDWVKGYARHAATIGSVKKDAEPSPIKGPLAKNTQFFALGIGRLLFIAISTTVPKLTLGFPNEFNHIIRRIHPFTGKVIWPPIGRLNDEAITSIIMKFGDYLDSLKWAPVV